MSELDFSPQQNPRILLILLVVGFFLLLNNTLFIQIHEAQISVVLFSRASWLNSIISLKDDEEPSEFEKVNNTVEQIKYIVNAKEAASIKFKNRKIRIKQFCKKRLHESQILQGLNSNLSEWLHGGKQWNLPNEHLSFCDIPLNGGASWTHNLIGLAGKTRTQVITEFKNSGSKFQDLREFLKKEVFIMPENRTIHDHLTVLFVRNPLRRLVSGYYQKFVTDFRRRNNEKNLFYKELMPLKNNLIRMFRTPRVPDAKLDDTVLTPKEYMAFVLQNKKHRQNLIGIFKPQVEFCPICLIDYDVVGHLETYQEDTLFVMNSARITGRVDPYIHVNKFPDEEVFAHEDRERFFYSQIPKNWIRKLHKTYEMDFEAFGYENELEEFVSMGMDSDEEVPRPRL